MAIAEYELLLRFEAHSVDGDPSDIALPPIDAARKAAVGGVAQMKERDIVGAEESFDGRIEIACRDQRRVDDLFGVRVGADDKLLPEIVGR